MKYLMSVIVIGLLSCSYNESTVNSATINRSSALFSDTNKIVKTDKEWKEQLTAEQFNVTRQQGTERAFTGAYWDNIEVGGYHCICCDNLLFESETKFKSGTGWPSFYDIVSKENVGEVEDNKFGMKRVEVVCLKCDAHLGHVFKDGPKPTGLRYCINSASLNFKKK